METNGTTAWHNTEAGQRLQERLTNEKTLRALDHLLERIDTLEEAVERLTTLMQQGPGLVSMAADWADESYRRAQAHGLEPEARLKNALHLAEKLTAPEMVEKLDQVFQLADQGPGLASMLADWADESVRRSAEQGVDLEERLRMALHLAEKLTAPEMAAKLDHALRLADQAPGLASMLADWADDTYRQAAASGVDLEERLRVALQFAEKLTDPAVAEKLDDALTLVEQGPGLAAMAIDTFDENYRRALENGVDFQVLTRQGINITKKLSDLLDSEEAEALLESGVFKPQTLAIISKAGESLIESRGMPARKVGLFGLLGALRDPDRQRALGFLMDFLKAFGQKL